MDYLRQKLTELGLADNKDKDCKTCLHKLDNPDGGHCYMFREEPATCWLNTRKLHTLRVITKAVAEGKVEA